MYRQLDGSKNQVNIFQRIYELELFKDISKQICYFQNLDNITNMLEKKHFRKKIFRNFSAQFLLRKMKKNTLNISWRYCRMVTEKKISG